MALTEWQADVVVIGAGVVGLAVARALAHCGREVLLLEAGERIGEQTSSRNSGVIHAGIYYPPGSLKARLCVEGKQLLYRYCQQRDIAHQRIGKLMVAVDASQRDKLDDYRQRAQANGVKDLRKLGEADLRALEPELRAVAGLFSPSTGIVDVAALMYQLQRDLQEAGGHVVLHSPVKGGWLRETGPLLELGGEQSCRLAARLVINSAGLQAVELARRIEGMPVDKLPLPRYAKGNYFSLSGKAPFRHLVYPMPEPGGLGVHWTLDVAGQGRFGPDVQWLLDEAAMHYRVDSRRSEAFARAIRCYYPGLDPRRLQPDYAGIRPKLVGPGEGDADFLISGGAAQGMPGWINLLGIESPGLTSSMAIANHVVAMAKVL